MKPYEGVDEEAWASCEPGWLGVWKGTEPGTSKVRVSPPRGGGGGGEAKGGMKAEGLTPHTQGWVS